MCPLTLSSSLSVAHSLIALGRMCPLPPPLSTTAAAAFFTFQPQERLTARCRTDPKGRTLSRGGALDVPAPLRLAPVRSGVKYDRKPPVPASPIPALPSPPHCSCGLSACFSQPGQEAIHKPWQTGDKGSREQKRHRDRLSFKKHIAGSQMGRDSPVAVPVQGRPGAGTPGHSACPCRLPSL